VRGGESNPGVKRGSIWGLGGDRDLGLASKCSKHYFAVSDAGRGGEGSEWKGRASGGVS